MSPADAARETPEMERLRELHDRVAACSSRATVKRSGDDWPACDCGLDEFRFTVVEQTCQIINAILDGDPGPHHFGSDKLTTLAERLAALRDARNVGEALADGVRHAQREKALLGVHSSRLPEMAERFAALTPHTTTDATPSR